MTVLPRVARLPGGISSRRPDFRVLRWAARSEGPALPRACATFLPPGARMPEPTAMVFVVEDDASVREALASLIRSAGWNVEAFVSAHEVLATARADAPSCLVLDVGLP